MSAILFLGFWFIFWPESFGRHIKKVHDGFTHDGMTTVKGGDA